MTMKFQTLRVIVLAALAITVLMVAVAAAPMIGNLPLTKHAQTAHEGQLYSAAKIVARRSARSCQPIESYSCKQTIVVMCPVGPDPNQLWMGLVIGTANPAGPCVVTGYAAPSWYWHSRVTGCSPMAIVP